MQQACLKVLTLPMNFLIPFTYVQYADAEREVNSSGHVILNWRKKRRRQHNMIASNVRMSNKWIFTMATFLKVLMAMGASLSGRALLRSRQDSKTGRKRRRQHNMILSCHWKVVPLHPASQSMTMTMVQHISAQISISTYAINYRYVTNNLFE